MLQRLLGHTTLIMLALAYSIYQQIDAHSIQTILGQILKEIKA